MRREVRFTTLPAAVHPYFEAILSSTDYAILEGGCDPI